MAQRRHATERGNVLPDDFPLQPGESRGTDLAEGLEHLAIRLETEIYGPADLRQGPTREQGRE